MGVEVNIWPSSLPTSGCIAATLHSSNRKWEKSAVASLLDLIKLPGYILLRLFLQDIVCQLRYLLFQLTTEFIVIIQKLSDSSQSVAKIV